MRRILITGTTRGLGRHLAEHYLACGDRVIGCGRSAAVVTHEQYRHHTVDITDDTSVAALYRALRRDEGHLDVLINNAGTASMNAFALTPPRSSRKVVSTNLLGTMLMCHAAIRMLRRSRHGRIVNLTTIAVPLRDDDPAGRLSFQKCSHRAISVAPTRPAMQGWWDLGAATVAVLEATISGSAQASNQREWAL